MEEYSKIIESLGINFVSVSERNLIRPLTISGYQAISNTLIYLRRGSVTFGKQNEAMEEGDILFIPGTKPTQVSFGNGGEVVSYEKFSAKTEDFFTSDVENAEMRDAHIMLCFEAKLFDAISYFSSLDIPAFALRGNREIPELMDKIVEESGKNRTGRERVINALTEHIVIEVMRYILDKQLFLEQLATNTTYFKDPRLIDIFKYIKENLSGDLSNKVLANVANVSEDYVGQYFKMLTGINPQDYIEYQRMERAVYLLRTTKRSIREIGKDVGYKDTAYFCRRFKMMFGIPAGKMRRREKMNS